jgi:hypothetical protein
VVASFIDAFEPARYSGEDAESLVATFTRLSHLGMAGTTLAATRAAEANRHTASGHRTPAEWLAAQTGESVGDALGTLRLGERLSSQPGLDGALRTGALSAARARMVSEAAKDNPAREEDLVRGARTDTQRQFHQRCLRARAEGRSAEEEGAHAARLHRNRRCTTFTTNEGAFGLTAILSPGEGAKVAASLRAQADRSFHQARVNGQPEHPDAYAADALVALVTGQGVLPPPTRGGRQRATGPGSTETAPPAGPDRPSEGPWDSDATDTVVLPPPDGDPEARRSIDLQPTDPQPTDPQPGDLRAPSSLRPDPKTWVLIRADLDALRRGSVGPGEVCEIPGVGPVPVSHAREVLGDALCHLVITNGIDVTTVCTLGRHVPEALRVAIIERDRSCVVPGCGRDLALENDHWQVDFAKGGEASLDNICRLCRWHHHLKTHQGWRLTKREGEWHFLPPGTDPPTGEHTTDPTVTPRRARRTGRRPDPGPGPPLFDLEE